MDNKNSWIKDWEIQSDKDGMRQDQTDLPNIKTGPRSGHDGKPPFIKLWTWIMMAGLAVVALVITLVITITSKGKNKEEIPFVNQVENFVNRTESLSSSFDASGWDNADAEFGAHLTRYKRIYDSLSTSELDRVDDAIERYTILCRRYRGTPAGEKSSFVVDDIEYSYSNPTIDQLHQWKNQYASICTTKLKNMYFQDFSIPNGMKEKDPCLVYLLMKSKSCSKKEEKQNWFNLYSVMEDDKVDKLYDILYREAYKIAEINKKYEIKKQVNQLNSEAYKYVKAGDFYNAYMTIDHAIALEPDNPNLYDSKGEFYLIQGRLDKALFMWNKVLKTNSNFLDMYDGHTNLYDGLVEKGMIKR